MSGIATSSLLPDPPRRSLRSQRRHPEDDLQRSVVQFLRVALPDDAIAYAVPNGGQRHSKAAARLVGLGVRAGIPDLAIVWRGHALFVELKAARGTLSAVQRQMIDKLHVCGADVVVCKSLECVEGSLREMGVPLRASCTDRIGRADWRPRSRGYDQAQLAPWSAP